MKKVLIIAEYFAPQNEIAAIRLTKLAKYFKINAVYNITAISKGTVKTYITDPILQKNLKYVDEHIVVTNSKVLLKFISFINQLWKIIKSKCGIKADVKENSDKAINKTGILASLRKHLSIAIGELVVRDYRNKALKKINKSISNYDVVLSTYGDRASHLIAFEVKNHNPSILWIADFRDPVMAFYNKDSEEIVRYLKKYMAKISLKADLITGVTTACVQGLEIPSSDKLKIICNGFDRDDLIGIDMDPLAKFTLTYTGELYEGRSDLRAVFKAISELISERYIDKNNIVINYAGRSEIDFIQQLEMFDLAGVINVHGLVNRSLSLKLQMNSSILLLASWNSIGETGVITGKFLEYLMINKPIVCTVTGNLANSQIKEMMIMANNGIVWEEANDKVDYPVLKGYIIEQYERFINNKPLRFEPNMEYIERFNYKNIAQQFIDLIEDNSRK